MNFDQRPTLDRSNLANVRACVVHFKDTYRIRGINMYLPTFQSSNAHFQLQYLYGCHNQVLPAIGFAITESCMH